MNAISISERYGQDISSRAIAAQLRLEIQSTVRACSTPITLDFSGVRTISDSFADELFAVLVAENGESWFKNFIRVVNLESLLRETVLVAINQRLQAA